MMNYAGSGLQPPVQSYMAVEPAQPALEVDYYNQNPSAAGYPGVGQQFQSPQTYAAAPSAPYYQDVIAGVPPPMPNMTLSQPDTRMVQQVSI